MKNQKDKFFRFALMLTVAYFFILFASTVEAKNRKKKKRYVRPASMINACAPTVSAITQSWNNATYILTVNVDWSCVGVNNQPCSIYITAHIYRNGMPYPPDDPINFKINNIWSGSDSIACGTGKRTQLPIFIGNAPIGNYSSDVDVFVGSEQTHGFDSIFNNVYNWTIN